MRTIHMVTVALGILGGLSCKHTRQGGSGSNQAAKPPPVRNAGQESHVQLAFVLLSKAELPRAEGILRAHRALFPTAPKLAVEPPRKRPAQGAAKKNGTPEVLSLRLEGGHAVFVTLIPLPVPKGEAEAAARYSVSALGTGWKLPSHTAHLVVAMPSGPVLSTLERLHRFTDVLAAVVKATPAVGVYNGMARATHNPKFYLDVAKARGVEPRLMVWTGISVATRPDGRTSLLSYGMKQLGLPDLLLIAPTGKSTETLEFYYSLLRYVVQRGKPIPPGETVGRTAAEKLPVHYVPSPANPKTTVWSVEIK